jgi:uncharacterized cupredoxin-like copper-binding protein
MKITRVFRALTFCVGTAHAHPGGHDPLDSPRKAVPPPASRTVAIEMTDKGCKPAEITAATGETLRFAATNPTNVARELAIGPAEELKAHAEMVRKHPGMQGGKGARVSVKAGGAAELGWKASKPGSFAISCAAPGQFDASSSGKVVVGKS